MSDTKQTQSHWRKCFDYKFISAEDLEGKDVTLTIIGTGKSEAYNSKERKMETVPTLIFEGVKKHLVLNKTNAKIIHANTGTPYIEQWIGKQITIYPKAGVRAFGAVVDAIRVRVKK